jgi:hypothetical protein
MEFPCVTFALSLSPRSVLLTLSSLSLVFATGCAGGPLGTSLQKSLEADPQLQDQWVFGDEAVETEPRPDDLAIAPGEAPELDPGDPAVATVPQPGDPTFIGPVPPAEWSTATAASSSPPAVDRPNGPLADVPADLKPYVQDWLALGLVAKDASDPGDRFSDIAFQPNQTISRQDYAQWLLAANNQFYRDQPAKRIRPGAASSTPAFQDVPSSHPNYGAIQGLAEAGIIPSALTGNSTAVTFRPDDPLTRETLVLWKVPLDTRTALPAATVEAVQTTWGFQDAAEVEPLALRAVLADRQTGDFANILRAFGYTTLLQPKKAVSQAEAAAVLWRFGSQTEGVSAQDVLSRSTATEAE